MTIKRYLIDASLTGRVTVTAIAEGESPSVRFAETWFHPQGGGQKADRGSVGPARVIAVRHAEGGEVDHFVDSTSGLQIGSSYPFAIDADWRATNARYHSAGHLIAGAGEEMFPGVRAVNGHQWPGEARVEFDGVELDRIVAGLSQLEVAVNDVISGGGGVSLRGDPFSDRQVQIGSFSPIPCGGTHAATVAEIGPVRLRSAKIKGGLARVGYELIG